MSEKLKTFPKKLLIHFIQKHPHHCYLKNSSRHSVDELTDIICKDDILITWDRTAYELCNKPLLMSLCEDMIRKYQEIGKEQSFKKNKILKNRKTMIDFLCGETSVDIIFSQIQNCLRKQENIDISQEEMFSYL